MDRIRERLTYANVMATIAVFLALGGGAYAITLSKNDVRSRHIKNGQVKAVDADPEQLVLGSHTGTEPGGPEVHTALFNLGSTGAQVQLDKLRLERQSATAFRVCAEGAIDPNGDPWVIYRGNGTGNTGESRSANFFTAGSPCSSDVTSTAIGEDYTIFARDTVVHLVPDLNINSRWTVVAIEAP